MISEPRGQYSAYSLPLEPAVCPHPQLFGKHSKSKKRGIVPNIVTKNEVCKNILS
jgi:hypothetical protein